MNRKRHMNESFAVKSNVYSGPFAGLAMEQQEPEGLSFWQRRALDLQITTMVQPTKPYWNPTMVSAWCAVAGAVILILGSIAGLYVYTRNTSLEEGRRMGAAEEREKQVSERLQQVEADTRKKKELELLNSGANHPQPKEKH